MPLTKKGKKILRSMRKQHGERAEEVLYRSENAGKITGIHPGGKRGKAKGRKKH